MTNTINIKDCRQKEVEWYKKNGLFPERRIVRDSRGKEYVVGDATWQWCYQPSEEIEKRMKSDGVYQ